MSGEAPFASWGVGLPTASVLLASSSSSSDVLK